MSTIEQAPDSAPVMTVPAPYAADQPQQERTPGDAANGYAGMMRRAFEFDEAASAIRSAFLTHLVAGMQLALTGSVRQRAPRADRRGPPRIKPAEQLAMLGVVGRMFTEAVEAVAPPQWSHQHRTRKTSFTRFAVARLEAYIREGGDVTDIMPGDAEETIRDGHKTPAPAARDREIGAIQETLRMLSDRLRGLEK